jgi:hypothetical protein
MDAAALEAAFRATIYRVDTPEGSFDLRIGVTNPVFEDYLRAQGVCCWGVITACNPGAVRLSNEENRLRLAELHDSLGRSGWPFFEACNLAADGVWPAEPGYFIHQIDQGRLCALAARFSQLAVLWGETGAPPRLLWVSGRDAGVT